MSATTTARPNPVDLPEQKVSLGKDDQKLSVLSSSSGSAPKPILSPFVDDSSSTSPATLTLNLARLHQYDLLNAVYRNYLSTHLESAHVWYLLSLSLLSSHRLDESFLAIRECLTRSSEDVPALLLASHISLRMRKGKESVEYASRAMRGCKAGIAARQARDALEMQLAAASAAGTSPRTMGILASGLTSSSSAITSPSASTHTFHSLSHPSITSTLLQSCQLLFGVACSRYAYQVSTFSNRKSLQKRALHALENAYKLHGSSSSSSSSTSSSNNTLNNTTRNQHVVFSLACLCADIREIPRALSLTKRALELDRTDVHHWCLLALLLTSQKKYHSALQACEQGLLLLTPTTNSTPLLLVRAKIQAHLGFLDDAVAGFVDLVRTRFGDSSPMRTYTSSSTGQSKVRPIFHPMRKCESTEKIENAAVDHAHAAALSGVGVNTEEESEIERATQQVDILLALAQVYASHVPVPSSSHSTTTSSTATTSSSSSTTQSSSKPDEWITDALDAVFYARERAPTHMLPDIHAALAALTAQAGSSTTAVRHYESALVLDAHHTASLLGLARIETQRAQGGNITLAYGYLMSALQVDATSHQAWYEMAMILQAQGKSSAAAEHFITSLQLEQTAPLASFQTLPRRVA